MSEHLLLFPDRDVAEEIGDDLAAEGFEEVRVVRIAHAGEDDAEDHEWGVLVRVEEQDNSEDTSDAGAGALHARFEALAHEHDGWYDPEPTGT